MLDIVAIFLGGALGALARFVLMNKIVFPLIQNILIINALGSVFIGFLYEIFKGFTFSFVLEKFLIIGFLGAFTTFSAYSLDIFKLLVNFKFKEAFFYIFIINFLAIIGVGVGIFIAKLARLLFLK